MHFQGQQLVSQSTYVSNRTLVTVAAAKIIAFWLPIDTTNLEVLGLKLGDSFDRIAPILILFFLVNHLLSWLGDYRSFTGWNSSSRPSSETLFSSPANTLRSEVENLVSHIGNLQYMIEEMAKNAKQQTDEFHFESAREITGSMKSAADQLKKLNVGVSKLSSHATIYFYGWMLATPVFLAIYAIFLSLFCY